MRRRGLFIVIRVGVEGFIMPGALIRVALYSGVELGRAGGLILPWRGREGRNSGAERATYAAGTIEVIRVGG